MASKPKLANDPRAERDQVPENLVAKKRTLIMVNQPVKVVNRACFRKPNNCENDRPEETAKIAASHSLRSHSESLNNSKISKFTIHSL